jgi:hypothetical protein
VSCATCACFGNLRSLLSCRKTFGGYVKKVEVRSHNVAENRAFGEEGSNPSAFSSRTCQSVTPIGTGLPGASISEDAIGDNFRGPVFAARSKSNRAVDLALACQPLPSPEA